MIIKGVVIRLADINGIKLSNDETEETEKKAGIRREDISDLFVTHAHTDHLLGCIWVIRMALEDGKSLRVWSHAKVLNLLTSICQQILPKNQAESMEELVTMHLLEDGDKFEAGGFPLQCFDIHSTKERQFGFTAQLSGGRRLCCLGDSPREIYDGGEDGF